MKVITPTVQARSCIRAQMAYGAPDPSFRLYWGQTRADLLERISKLDPETATPDQVRDAYMGHWDGLSYCDECGQRVEVVVQLGAEPDYDSATAELCLPCIEKAAALGAALSQEAGRG